MAAGHEYSESLKWDDINKDLLPTSTQEINQRAVQCALAGILKSGVLSVGIVSFEGLMIAMIPPIKPWLQLFLWARMIHKFPCSYYPFLTFTLGIL